MSKRRCPYTFQKGRRIHCYLYLILWIISFTTVLYWFLNNSIQLRKPQIGQRSSQQDDVATFHKEYFDETLHFVTQSTQEEEEEVESVQFHSVQRLCNRRELIQPKSEYLILPDFKLEGLIILLRHGDRGPLTHIGHRNISNISCADVHPQYSELLNFAKDSILKIPGYFQFIGPFHSFPMVPQTTACSLGQLTVTGVMQLLAVGKLVRKTYERSGIFGNETFPGLKVTAYSTRYRRTFQSLFAFLYGFLGPHEMVPSVTITESQSTAFCFNHCSCSAAEGLKKRAILKSKRKPERDNFRMEKLTDELNYLLELGRLRKSGLSLLDSLLLYVCHNAPLPCKTRKSRSHHRQKDCVTLDQLQKLVDLIESENQRLKETSEYYQHSLLISYGLMKEILSLALHMTSSGTNQNEQSRGRVAVFSGHDKTLQGLLGALNVLSGQDDLNLPPYASRFIIEIYRKITLPESSVRKHFLRFVYNGDNITHRVSFCRNTSSVTSQSGQIFHLCPLESLVRFFHDSYFDAFPKSVVNFRDACRT